MATYTSAGTGNWSSGATWVGGVKPPSAGGHKVVIATGHTVTYDEASGTYGDDTSSGIQVLGTLKLSRAMSTTLTCRGDLFVDTGGTADFGTEADPIPNPYVALIQLNDSAAPAHNKWGLRTNDTTNWSGFRLWGAAKTAVTTMPSGALSTDTVITVADATGWQVGDILVFDCSVAQASVTGQVYRAITNIAGNVITVGANLGYDSQVGRVVANLTRNVRVVGLNGNTYRSQIAIRLQSNFSVVGAIEMGNCEIVLTGGHASNSWQFGGLNLVWASASSVTAAVKKTQGIVCHDVHSVVGSTVTSTAGGGVHVNHFTNQAYNYTMEGCVISSYALRSAVNLYNGTSTNYNNATILKSSTAFSTGYSQGPVECYVRNSRISGCSSNGVSGTGISIYFENCVFDFQPRYCGNNFNAYGVLKFTNCTFGDQLSFTTPTNPWQLANGSQAPTMYETCTLKDLPTFSRSLSNMQNVKPGAFIRLRNVNNDPSLQYLWDYAGEKIKDASTKYRGTQSIRLDCWYSANPNTYSRAIAVVAGQTIMVVGYLRFNALYGTATPPRVTISGLGITPATFTAAATADTWQKFTLTVTNPQAYAGEFTLTVTGQSAADASAAYCWIDGIPFVDFVDSVRHYGYVFDGLPYRTVDTSISQATEATVAAYATIDTLDQLHDRLSLWACENQGSAVFYSGSGTELALGSYNLVVDATAAAAFDIAGSTITIKSSLLTAGTKFDKVSTTGTISKSNGAIISALYEDASGPSAKLVLHLPLASMAVCVHDGTGAEVECGVRTGTYTLLVDPGATGTWKWAANKQGYVFATGSFTPGTGGVFELSPSCPQVTTPDGNPMYQGTTSALVQVSFSGGYAYIDIGDGTPTLQAIYDECEDAMYTDEGIDWIIDGGDGVSIFNSSGGDYLFMTGGWRLRRWHAGDSNATVPAFVQSVDGTPVDGVNGPVQYLTSDSPTAIAAAVWAHLSGLAVKRNTDLIPVLL